jgi:glycosyltransferase involved in cell wall biosynthesis
VVVGTGPYEEAARARAGRLGLAERIIWTGYVPHDEAPHYLSSVDVLVLPSETRPNWKEQFGRVIIEALACGTPLVGSDSGEIPYVLRHTGGGLIFPEGKPEALAEQLRVMIIDPEMRGRLAEAGRRVVLRDYTDRALASRFAETVEDAVRRYNTRRDDSRVCTETVFTPVERR